MSNGKVSNTRRPTPAASDRVDEKSPSVAFVTGGGGGIGAAVARALAADGHCVGIFDLDAQAAAETLGSIDRTGPSMAAGLDVCDSAAVESAVGHVESALGPITTVVNVAGVLQHGLVEDTTDDTWRSTFAVNVDGVFNVARATTRRMRERGRGSLVTVASNAAGVARHAMAAYAASKAAAAHFTRCLGLELAPHGIRCNIVSPGSTDTAMLHELWRDENGRSGSLYGIPKEFRVGIPLGRIGTPDQVAEAVVFLASARAGHITMQDLYIDGGATLRA